MVQAPSSEALSKAKNILAEAINRKDMQPVINIVNKGYPVNEPILYGGVTILMHISGTCTSTELDQVMELNPDLNAKDSLGRSALHFACRAGKIDTFNNLAEREDTEIDAVTNAGVTPLMMAIESGDIELVAACLNNNLNPFLRDAIDRTAIDYAVHYRDVLGHDMRKLIQIAMDQWMS